MEDILSRTEFCTEGTGLCAIAVFMFYHVKNIGTTATGVQLTIAWPS